MAEPLLRVEHVSKRFGGLLAVDRRLVHGASRTHHRADRAERRRQDHAVLRSSPGSCRRARAASSIAGADITGEPPHRLARRGIARTFQIVQPFAGLTVRENIAVGAHLSRPARRDALAAAGDGRARGRARRRCSTGRPQASRSPAASGSSSPARLRSSRGSCCSTRCSPASTPPRSATSCRSSGPSAIAASPCDDRARDAGGDEPRRACLRAGRGPHHRGRLAAGDRERSARRWRPISAMVRPPDAAAAESGP